MKKLVMIIFMMFAINAFADEYTDMSAAAESAGVPSELAVQVSNELKTRNFQAESALRIREMMQKSIGSQAVSVMEKVAEGIAKNVPESRIMGAVETIGARYEYASKLADRMQVKQAERNEFCDAVADAMAAGATRQKLDETAQGLKSSQHTYKVMQLYKTMMQYGVEESKVSKVSVQASGMNHQQISEYRSAFMKGASRGNASSMADQMERGMKAGRSASEMGRSSGGSMGGGGMGGGSGSGSGGHGGGGGGHGGGGRK